MGDKNPKKLKKKKQTGEKSVAEPVILVEPQGAKKPKKGNK